MSNLNAVQNIYVAFGQGDIPSILDHLDENVNWEYAYRETPNPVPWLQPQDGKADVANFFKSLQDHLEIHHFAIHTIAEAPGVIVALACLECTVKSSGKRIKEEDEAHIWYFNEAGKVVRFRHCADTLQHLNACTR